MLKNQTSRHLSCSPDLLIVVADPHGDRRAPVSVPGNGPVARISQPVAEALLAHKIRNPARDVRYHELHSRYNLKPVVPCKPFSDAEIKEYINEVMETIFLRQTKRGNDS